MHEPSSPTFIADVMPGCQDERLAELVERERELRLTDGYWRIVHLLHAYARAHSIAFEAAVATLDGPGETDRAHSRACNVLYAINAHFTSEILRAVGK